MDLERRFFEFRQTGRTLSGIAVPYLRTVILPWGKERFLPKAFGDVQGLDVLLTAHHRRDKTHRPNVRRGPHADRFGRVNFGSRPILPESRDGNDILLPCVKSKVLRGLSIEFLQHNREGW